MIGWPTGMAIHLAVAPVDFRKAFDGLCIEIVEVLERDPLSGELFVFRNRAGDKLKALYWDGQGFVMIYKRLEKGRFKWPHHAEGDTEEEFRLSRSQLQALFEGIDWRRLEMPPRCLATATG
ncbi:IS66 family insertion sequence element accessory protein TnpB [Ectothiorhodospira lacustris]|uniref:IS66 family insertion sequence element accessory protein TnpB n=1 Tax=Ectothiorhodospira lacustris TaxID=2899127 RepID=UPI001EE79B17|nr:IS66 family insertion sequence element accessory protein TnpB [Ectothiorhodospira lacustris]MCG5501458.1 IS66 family insertion sequence element accessory protein TnpB [Ectothiorhodospira lacustris]